MRSSLLLLAVLAAGACPGKQAAGPGSGAHGSGVAPVTGATTCADVRVRVEQLYRAEATAKEPGRIDEAVADNTAMVMNDCARDPATFVPCIAAAPSVAELERTCLVPIDDEGTEGER
jgi:hypothetical protein